LKIESDHPLEKDRRWDRWSITSTQYFERLGSKIKFSPPVSDDITQRFEVVKKLLFYSFFVYDFLDVALERSLLTFELALRKRYFEITSSKPSKKKSSLAKLIKWATEQELFEDDEQVIHALKRIRNETAHPKSYQLWGHLSIELILRTVEIINDLYEDVDLRRTRKQKEKQANDELDKFLENGAILESTDKRLIIFKAVLLFCNNKNERTIYRFLFWPIFDAGVKDKSVDICDPILVNCDSWKYVDDKLIFNEMNGQRLKLNRIDSVENGRKFDHWKQAFTSSNFPLSFFVNSRIGELKLQYRNKVS